MYYHAALALLDKERKEHNNLKVTWQMANDQFLEAQRLLMIDMKRLESVLTEEQQRRVAGIYLLIISNPRIDNVPYHTIPL